MSTFQIVKEQVKIFSKITNRYCIIYNIAPGLKVSSSLFENFKNAAAAAKFY